MLSRFMLNTDTNTIQELSKFNTFYDNLKRRYWYSKRGYYCEPDMPFFAWTVTIKLRLQSL